MTSTSSWILHGRETLNTLRRYPIMKLLKSHNLRGVNAEYSPPLPDNEVVKVAQSAWGYEERGENWIGRGGRIVSFTIAMSIFLAAAHTDAFALLAILRRQHWAPVDFILSNAMANSLGWSLRRFRSARDYLVECGKLRCVHRAGGGPHDPPKFQLLERVQFRSPI
jgi:hypothetical protein